MENRNSHKAIPGLVAVLLTCAPKDILKGTFVSHEIVLIQGLVYNENQQLVIVYHKWINDINRTDLYDLLVCDLSNECIIDQLFHEEPCSIEASNVNVMYFNQVSGVSHSSFSRYVSTCSHSSGLDVFQSSLQQDHWCMGRLRRKTIEHNYKFLRFTMQPQLRPNVYLGNKKHKNKNAILAGLSRTHQDKNQLVFALYCLQFKSRLFEKYFLQVLPSIRSDDYQDFVPLTKKESGQLDDMCRDGPVPVEQLRSKMIDFAKVNNRRLLRLRRMKPNIDGKPIHYVVSLVTDPEVCTSAKLPVYATTPSGKPYIWCERLPRVMYDFELQIGFPIGHFFVSTLKRFVTPSMKSLVGLYLKGRGLVRTKTPHFGSFFVVGTRHSTMSNRTMNQYHPTDHNYGNVDSTNLSIGPWVKSLLNSLKSHASIIGSHCGMAMDGLCRKIEGNVVIQKSWGLVTWNYANTNHIDNDWNYQQFRGVVDFVTGCGNENLIQYLKRYQNVFQSEYVKLRLPLSTSCNWLHDGWSEDWTHIQYFCVTDAGLAFDISSDMFSTSINQLSGSFYGGLFGHQTSRSIWISSDGKMATTVCPSKRFWLFAWGEYRSSN